MGNENKNKISNGMKILICTGIYPPDIGGPAQYADNLKDEFLKQGNAVKILTYKLEKKLPIGIRHCLYFFRAIFAFINADFIIALDTFSVGFPSVVAARILRKKIILRAGGDFLWESCVERTGNLVTLRDFYAKMPRLPLKQRLIYFLQKFALKNCTALVFNNSWAREIFEKNYNLNPKKSFVIENFYGEKINSFEPKEKNFIWAGRPLKLKNINLLKDIFQELEKERPDIKLEIAEKLSHEELMERIKNCYAVILPSISDISPNFILDAIRADKPFILTKETGLYARLKDIGIFIDFSNKDDIKEKILFLARDDNYAKYKKRIENFHFVHSWKQIADEYLAIYKNL